MLKEGVSGLINFVTSIKLNPILAGLYIHIPFCRRTCHYCNFHFSTSLRLKTEMIDALVREVQLRADYLEKRELATVYFGGGTPSVLEERDLEKLFSAVSAYFHWLEDAEITMEVNPEDLTTEKLSTIRNFPFNRLSIGIQSFHQEDLTYMNRRHTPEQAEKCISNAREAGFQNISIDLIYGCPTSDEGSWRANLDALRSFQIPHFSAYALTVEDKTPLFHMINRGKAQPPGEVETVNQFRDLLDFAASEKYEHYELSNFAMPGYRSVHNSMYWSGSPYLGIGPSAHSYNGKSRQWNISHNPKYIESLRDGVIPSKFEILTLKDHYNEYVLTRIRTIEGILGKEIGAFGDELDRFFQNKVDDLVREDWLEKEGDAYRLTRSGKLFADRAAERLFAV
jgi:oxygen-independent coproporphyrinogen-3 oxidase